MNILGENQGNGYNDFYNWGELGSHNGEIFGFAKARRGSNARQPAKEISIFLTFSKHSDNRSAYFKGLDEGRN